jgi:hypothetical protein
MTAAEARKVALDSAHTKILRASLRRGRHREALLADAIRHLMVGSHSTRDGWARR